METIAVAYLVSMLEPDKDLNVGYTNWPSPALVQRHGQIDDVDDFGGVYSWYTESTRGTRLRCAAKAYGKQARHDRRLPLKNLHGFEVVRPVGCDVLERYVDQAH